MKSDLEEALELAERLKGSGDVEDLCADLARRLKLAVDAMGSLIEQVPNEDTGYYKDRGHRIKAALREIKEPPAKKKYNPFPGRDHGSDGDYS